MALKEMKQDSSTIAWNAMGDEWFELARIHGGIHGEYMGDGSTA